MLKKVTLKMLTYYKKIVFLLYHSNILLLISLKINNKFSIFIEPGQTKMRQIDLQLI